MLCYRCKDQTSFGTSKALIDHLKSIHGQTTYICVQRECSQIFQNEKSFEKHLNSHIRQGVLNADEPMRIDPEASIDRFDVRAANLGEKESSDINLVKIQGEFSKKSAEVLTQLHSVNHFSREDVYSFKDNVADLTSHFSTLLKKFVGDIPTDRRQEFETILNMMDKPFDHVDTEYKYLKELRRLGVYKDPVECKIDNDVVHLIPLKFYLKKVLEKPNVFQNVFNHMENCIAQEELCNFVSGSIYKEKKHLFGNRITLPYIIYMDDFEINNPLGAHSRKDAIKGVYFKLTNMPEKWGSKLDFIFPIMFARRSVTDDKKNRSFADLVNLLNELAYEGIEVEVNESKINIYFYLALITGDHAELNKTLRYTNSYKNKFYCRLCKRKLNYLRTDCEEFDKFLRNIQNYNSDLAKNTKIREKATGIIEESIFNNIEFFHVSDNFYSDCMHDVFEGVTHYVFCKSLKRLIYEQKLFSLEYLNDRKRNYKYSEQDHPSSVDITKNHLKKEKLKMSAAECITFSNILMSLIENKVPSDNEVLKLLKLHNEFINIIMKNTLSTQDINKLKQTVKEHNLEYQRIFETHLKPKFHYLVHYGTMIEKCGPLRNIWCMRMEGKNKEYKDYSKNITSRQNISLSIAIKASLKVANILLSPIDC